MKTVYKYNLQPGKNLIPMPSGAEFVSVDTQNNQAYIWMYVDTMCNTEFRNFLVIGTGHNAKDHFLGSIKQSDLKPLGSFSAENNALRFHVFEVNDNV